MRMCQIEETRDPCFVREHMTDVQQAPERAIGRHDSIGTGIERRRRRHGVERP